MWMLKVVALGVLGLQLALGQTTVAPDDETTIFGGGMEEETTVRMVKTRDPRFLGLLGFLAGLHFVDKDLFLDVGANHYHKGLFGFFRLSVEHPYDEGYPAPAQFPIMPLKDPIDVNVHVDSQSSSQSQALAQTQNDKFMTPAVQQDPIDEEVPEPTTTEFVETTTLESTTAAPKKRVTTTKRIFRPRSASNVKVKSKSKYQKRQAEAETTVEADTMVPNSTGIDGEDQTTTDSTSPTTTLPAVPTLSSSSRPLNNGYGASRTKDVDLISFTTTDSPFVGQNRLDFLVNNFKPSKPDYIRNVYSSGDFYPRAELNFID